MLHVLRPHLQKRNRTSAEHAGFSTEHTCPVFLPVFLPQSMPDRIVDLFLDSREEARYVFTRSARWWSRAKLKIGAWPCAIWERV